MEEFHTPESTGYPASTSSLRTPRTVSEAQRSSLPASGGGDLTTASGKKRPANTDAYDDEGDDDESMDDGKTSFFAGLISSVTPWRRKNKRARSSLDSMSGSAIKSITRLPASEDSDRSNEIMSDSNNASSGGNNKLGKLNLEQKFEASPAVAASTNAAAMPVQTLNGQETTVNNNEIEGNGTAAAATKRARFASTTTDNEGSVAAVRLGGISFVSSNATTPTDRQSNTVTFHDSTTTATTSNTATPKFRVGSSSTKLKDVRSRMATPARGSGQTPSRSRWTPTASSSGTTRYGNNNNALPQDGLIGVSGAVLNNKGGYQRRSINLSATSRGGGFRRRTINARKYRPMNSLLSRIHTDNAHVGGGGTNSKQQSLFLSNSIADQILRDTQNKLFSTTIGNPPQQQQETSFFGAVQEVNTGARTFEEEGATYRATVPRVKMNRVYGSGQTGGRALSAVLPSTTTEPTTLSTAGVSMPTGRATTTAAAAASSVSLQPSIIGKVNHAASSISFPSSAQITTASENTEVVPFEPYQSGPISARGEGKSQLTPCKPEVISKQLGEEIGKLMETDKFKAKAAQNDPFGDVGEATKVTKKKIRGTPHPKSARAPVTTPTSENAETTNGAPFNFMPGGAASSVKVNTPMAYSFSKKKLDVPQSSSPKKSSKSPAGTTSTAADTNDNSKPAPPPVSNGWGNIFADQMTQWKCSVCTSQNPKSETVCLSCESPKDGDASKSDATPSSGDNGAAAKTTASIGTGGFSFGAPAATATPAPAASSAGSIGAGGFSFGNKSTASLPTPETKPSETPPKKEKKDDAKGTGAGFSFGTTPAKTKPVSNGFSFGAPAASTSTAESNAGESDEKKDKSSIGSSGFSFGSASASSLSMTNTSTKSSGFNFGQTTAAPSGDENKGETANTGTFSFGASSSGQKAKRGRGDEDKDNQDGGKKANISGGFSFGANTDESKTTSSAPAPSAPAPAATFAFGAGSKKDEAPSTSTPAFAFGSASSEKKSDSAAPAFSFGATASTSKSQDNVPAATPGFSFGQSAPSTTPAPSEKESSKPAFSFGQSASSATPALEKKETSAPTPGPAFSFGQAPPSTATKTPVPAASAPPAASAAPAFQFGSQAPAAAPTAAASSFGGSGFGSQQSAAPQPAVTAPSFAFGSAPTPAPANATPSFSFGSAAQPAATPAPTGGFAFGSNPSAGTTPTPAFGMSPASTTPAPAFGMPPATTPAASFGGGGFGGAQTPGMNGAAASGGGFSIGTGGAKKTPGRRIVKARRPQR